MNKTSHIKIFGKNVCTDKVLKKSMSSRSFRNYKKSKALGLPLDKKTTNNIAKAIKKWAIANNVSHFSHIFFPLNNIVTEKQTAIIDRNKSGKPIELFNAKVLMKSEVDGSSFPNGKERSTAHARGYALWDYGSPIFFKQDDFGNRIMYIPAVFCSYLGTALDYKTPLLRSVESLNKQALRVLKLLGVKGIKRVDFCVGAEQEFFLIKSDAIKKRLDLKLAGRMILGGKPIMSQEQYSHYLKSIGPDINRILQETNMRLWEMGIMTKIQHSEMAPCQYELVPIFNNANISCDQNAIMMQTICDVASKHGFTAIFHEKPFDCFNGSGKHLNWSLSTDANINLFDTNSMPATVFFTFFIATIVAVDKYYKLLRYSIAYYPNDFRLGGNEAPTPLISVFTSEYILDWFKEIESGKRPSIPTLDIRLNTIPKQKLDFCDRNRTSPFAFTGNKFEFRMVGASQSIAFPATCICTALADSLMEIADSLESNNDIIPLLKKLLERHKRIIFNGDCYDNNWSKEANKRGLQEYKNTLSVLNILLDDDIINLFEKTGVLNKNELEIRQLVQQQDYLNCVMLEAKIMIEMLSKQVLPSLRKSTEQKHDIKLENERKILEFYLKKLMAFGDVTTPGNAIKISETMRAIRKVYDKIEGLIPTENQPFPTIDEIVF